MGHSVDGFDLKFTHRTSWKAARTLNGELIDVMPITWTKGWKKEGTENYLEVWFQDRTELEERNNSRVPFCVALAVAKDYSKQPHVFDRFQGIFEVVSTGKFLSNISIETKVYRRIKLE